jgi:hypothetical protein
LELTSNSGTRVSVTMGGFTYTELIQLLTTTCFDCCLPPLLRGYVQRSLDAMGQLSDQVEQNRMS